MKRNNYIVCEYGRYGWSLYAICGKNFNAAKKALKAAREEAPEGRFSIQIVPEKECWWKDSTMVK